MTIIKTQEWLVQDAKSSGIIVCSSEAKADKVMEQLGQFHDVYEWRDWQLHMPPHSDDFMLFDVYVVESVAYEY